MHRRNLPFSALRAFEAAARHGSVSGAAKELSVTHSAVSHQLKQLEAKLGVPLFIRNNRGLKIAQQGELLLPVLQESFDRISKSLDELRQHNQSNVTHVTCTPSFASKWLVPRLADWYAKVDASLIHLQPNLNFLDFKSDKIDIAIRCGTPPWKKLEHELLMPIHLVPVCSPQYLEAHGPFNYPEDLLACDLIHADIGDHGLGEEWRDWFTACNIECPKTIEGLSFHDPALAMQAAADGLGLAVGYRELIDNDLQSNKLVIASEPLVKHQFAYYLVYPSGQTHQSLTAFRAWLQAQ